MDKELCEKLYRMYYIRVYSYLMVLAKDKELAEELTQETFYRAYTAKSEFRRESGEETWLCAIAKNLFYDEMKRRGRLEEISEDTEVRENEEQKIDDREFSLKIHKAIHALDEPYREVFEQRVFGELSFAEIGTVFGKTESWARVTYHRAKIMIQKGLNSDDKS